MVDMDLAARKGRPAHPFREARLQMRAKISHCVAEECFDRWRRHPALYRLPQDVGDVAEAATLAKAGTDALGDSEFRVDSVAQAVAFARRQFRITPGHRFDIGRALCKPIGLGALAARGLGLLFLGSTLGEIG